MALEGGRFDFDDGGSYVGEWQEGRAHGLGVATGPENQGEYSGQWDTGFESRGVYIWPSGNIYSGTWYKGKRHGEGVQVKGRWIYRGAFTTGFFGRYGVKESLTSCAKYEGSWHLNQFDGFGVETNSDGSVYAGAWSKGMRQGLGIRQSAPYAFAAEFSRAVRASQSQNSIPSGTDSDRGWRSGTGGGAGSIGGGSGGDMRMTGDRSARMDERRSGFVLRSISCPPSSNTATNPSGYRSNTPEKRTIFQRGLFRKLRKQKSTGDLSIVGGQSSFGCGGGSGGGLFPNRGRRAGGSLRSTLSGSSQLTSHSFGRDEMRRLGNGGHALHEVMDEIPNPEVTETYSGQWNEDRRSGYGVAERSDGLKYAGEWFNNKKDGFGVTYHFNGIKEEGKYKENVLILTLNRKSKLFVLRHAKLRDAIEEAAKNAEDTARKAKENAYSSSYQRAATAREIATAADKQAQTARRLSEEGRSVAREFAPEFVQLGLQWEKQNPLLRKDLFGPFKDQNEPASTERQFQRNIRIDNPANGDGPTGHSLEIFGGSRQGSFRSSFRRHGANTHEPRMQDGRNHIGQNQSSPQNALNPMDDMGWSSRYHQEQQQYNSNGGGAGSIGQMPMMDPNQHRSPAGRPMARAATTGVAGIGYAQFDHRQMAQHLAQHPHSPYLMTSASQHLDDQTIHETHTYAVNANPTSNYGTMPRVGREPQYQSQQPRLAMATMHGPGMEMESINVANAQFSVTTAHRASEIRLAEAQLIPPSQAHHAAVRSMDAVTPGSVSSRPVSPSIHAMEMEYVAEEQVHYPTMSDVPLPPLAHARRRTLPSIMTEPPMHASTSSGTSAGIRDSDNRGRSGKDRVRVNRGRDRTSPIDEDTIHSVDNLPAHAAATYIIEDGIRKRVQAATKQQRARLPAAQRLPEDEEIDGRRPEWTTAYDPYRPAMESTGLLSYPGMPPPPPYSEQADRHQLPRTYRIESELSLLTPMRENSMPDLPSACDQFPTIPHARSHHARHGMGMTRDELTRLTQTRRLEIMREMERRKRGEIVIRLADIKDWIRENFVIVFVLLINASLVFLFFILLTGSVESPEDIEEPSVAATSQPLVTPATIQQASRVAKTAKKMIGAAIRKTKPGNPR